VTEGLEAAAAALDDEAPLSDLDVGSGGDDEALYPRSYALSLVVPIGLGPTAGADAGRLQALERLLLADRVSADELAELLALRKEWKAAGFGPKDLHALLPVYRALLAFGELLRKALDEHDSPDNHDRRAGAIRAVWVTVAFINTFGPWREAGVWRPLFHLGTALLDLDKDGSTPLMLKPVALKRDKDGSAPAKLEPATERRGRARRSQPEGFLALGAAIAMEAAYRTNGRNAQLSARQNAQLAARQVAKLLLDRDYPIGRTSERRTGKGRISKNKTAAEAAATTVKGWHRRLIEGRGPGAVFDDLIFDLWEQATKWMDEDPSVAELGPKHFVDQLPGLLRDAGDGFLNKSVFSAGSPPPPSS
jgi:hypothetical protein